MLHLILCPKDISAYVWTDKGASSNFKAVEGMNLFIGVCYNKYIVCVQDQGMKLMVAAFVGGPFFGVNRGVIVS